MKFTPEPQEDRCQAHHEERFFRALLESAPDAMVIVSSRGEIVLVNAQTEDLFGYRREELLGQPVELLVPQRCRETPLGHRPRFFIEPHVRPMGAGMALYGRRKVGAAFPVEIRLSAPEAGEGMLVLSAIGEVSERNAPEKTRRRFTAAPLRNAWEIEAKNRELTLSEARSRQLTEASLDAVVAADGHGRIPLRFEPRLQADQSARVDGRSTLDDSLFPAHATTGRVGEAARC
jgi:PAS domain S-box-containing protein